MGKRSPYRIISRTETPVIFRVPLDARYHGEAVAAEVIAVFLCEPGDLDGQTMACYSHGGQHGACSRDWYLLNTRLAMPDEYADLKAELEAGPYFYRLRVYTQVFRGLQIRFDQAVHFLRQRQKRACAAY